MLCCACVVIVSLSALAHTDTRTFFPKPFESGSETQGISEQKASLTKP